MPETAIAEDIEHHILVELLAEFGRHARGMDHGFGIVAVDVENRRFDHQGDVGRIGGGAREMRRGGKADLVVHHDMDGAAGAVPDKARQAETFGHDALARKGRIAVQQDRQNRGAVRVLQLRLFGAHLAQDHGVDRFEVRRVGRQRQVHGIAVEFAVRGGAEVVFHIARSVDVFGFEAAALEFVENGAVGFAHDIGQNRQAATVRHADHDVLDAQIAAAFDDLLHRGDEAFAAVQTKAFGAHVFDMEEFFKALGLDQLVQDRLAALAGELDFLAVALDALLEPTGLFGVRDMHVLQRECAAIGAFDDIHDLAQRGDLQAEHLIDKDRAVHIGLGKPVGLGVKLGVRLAPVQAQRVQIGGKVAANTVGADDHQRANAVQNGAFDRLVADLDAFFGGFGLDLVACAFGLGGHGPFAGQRRGQIVIGHRRPVAAPPRGAGGLGLDVQIRIAERAEKLLPRFIDRIGVIGVTGIHLLEILGVMTLHEGRGMEGIVRALIVHVTGSRGQMRKAA